MNVVSAPAVVSRQAPLRPPVRHAVVRVRWLLFNEPPLVLSSRWVSAIHVTSPVAYVMIRMCMEGDALQLLLENHEHSFLLVGSCDVLHGLEC